MGLRKIIENFNLKYVVLEVLIIVIGILIAFQVDNWKQNRNTRSQELRILRELNLSLTSDLNTIVGMENRCDHVIERLRILQLHLFNKQPYQDSLQEYAYRLVYEIQFQYRGSAFNNLKTIGVDLISNDSIKSRLVELYDYTYPRLSKMIDLEANKEKYLVYFDNQRILNYRPAADKRQLEIDEIIDPRVFNDPKFLDLVTTKMGSFIVVKRRFEVLRHDVKVLIDNITDELRER